jgi:glycosyltransferase involved in cell wall biosynthesis
MHVRYVTSALTPAVGGPFQSIGGLARHLAALPDTRVAVIGVASGGTAWREHTDNWRGCRLTVCEGRPLQRLECAARSLESATVGEGPQILHFGELWNVVALLEHRMGRFAEQVIVHSPRGMLEAWSLRHHAVRKSLAWLAGQRTVLRRVDLFHATSIEEVQSIRAAGFRQPVALVPNAVTVHEPPPSRVHSGVRTALALGRLHPKKGFADLIRAWSRLAPGDWRLVIAGPDEGGHAAELRRLVAAERCHGVELPGPHYGSDRTRLLNHADLFICSSYSENFGMVVAEAMERGLAVIATTGTPWKCLTQKQMGWWVKPGIDGLASALAEALALPQVELDRRGAAGRRHVEDHLGWPAVASAMGDAYRWVGSGGPPPATIHLH